MKQEVHYAMERATSVAELMDVLGDLDPAAKVFFVCDYGDHTHTQQALPVLSADQYDTRSLEKTAYSKSRVAFNEEVGEGQEWYCEKCDKEWSVDKCPRCNFPCVDQDGNTAEGRDEAEEIVILQ